MLKALELYGFKSFAERTRFEFPDGITVIVGPNGSGKSNVVDAIKWVLGEQSAKSLRGSDMADVIFKGGSTQGARKPMNVAEATIIFHNADGRLPIDAPEVHVTRRVYRSGEGEYMINRQPCRLRDIKDLFRGTGVGGDAYSLIEQGKVDRLLQASAKDRRAMFEEAAGISRFKAKKIEAQRRMERVDQNLLRLSDIVEEVDSRLRSVRAQAGKAKRYREYSDRLQELRTQVGMADWRRFSEKLHAMEREIARLQDEGAAFAAHAENLEVRVMEIDTESTSIQDRMQAEESRLARCRQQLVVLDSTIEQQRMRCRDLSEERTRYASHLVELNSRGGNLQERLDQAVRALADAEAEYQRIAAEMAEQEACVESLTGEFDRQRGDLERQRTEYVAQMRSAAALANDASSLRSQLAMLLESQQQRRTRLEELARELERCANELAATQAECDQVQSEVNAGDAELEIGQRELAENRRLLARRQEELTELRGRMSGAIERAAVLEELEQRHEGIGSGVSQLLDLAKEQSETAFGDVCGLLADFVEASVELAPLVDVALGDAAQHVVVKGDRLIDWVASGIYRPVSKVGLIPREDRESGPTLELELEPGVIGRADRLIDVHPESASVVRRILGTTWFVEDLRTAMELAATRGRGQRFVTRAGQLLEANGTLVTGPRLAAEGIVSRRSQLRELRNRIEVFEYQIQEGQREVQRLQQNNDRQETALRVSEELQSQRKHRLAELRAQCSVRQQREAEWQRSREKLEGECGAGDLQERELAGRLESAAAALATQESQAAESEASIRLKEQELESLDRQRQDQTKKLTKIQIEAAKREQRLGVLRAEREQFETARQERSRALRDAGLRLVQCNERLRQAEFEILRGTTDLSPLYLTKETLSRQLADFRSRRAGLLADRSTLTDQLQSQRKQIRHNEEQLHQRELSAGQVRHERNALVDRLRDDYGIDLQALEAPETGDELQQREQVEEEINSLRKRIHSLGAVNMDALAELDQLEARYHSLSSQFQDLKDSKEALERIIQKINGDSRRIFLETLETIRTNFHQLYRRAFGGGRADIVLEEGADVLEGGVEIIATPPGKPSFNNSLLSGGEKALTAVALLLAIFQFRPSPFCVLDEVDAPFDEANVGRFIDVLKDFLSFTKFVIVTHSKKTMTAANTLYGVTMQESGVSKRVSVQFDDVSEDGQISEEAVRRDAATRARGESDPAGDRGSEGGERDDEAA